MKNSPPEKKSPGREGIRGKKADFAIFFHPGLANEVLCPPHSRLRNCTGSALRLAG
jgi:hypothetical protein